MTMAPIQKLAQLLEMPPEQRQVLYTMGQKALAAGKVEEAIETLEVVTQLSPGEPGPWRTLAEAYRLGGYPKRAQVHELLAEELSR